MEERLSRRDHVFLVAAVLLTVAALAVGLTLFPSAFPEASVELRVDRRASLARADALREALGDAREDWLHAGRFVFDAEARSFLEREMGLARADSAFGAEVRLWRWAHRWFHPGRHEEWRIEIAATGELARLAHRVEESAPGAALSVEEARALAEAFLRERAGLDPACWRQVASRTQARPRRVDHGFTYEFEGRRWAGAPLRAEVTIQGDRVGGFDLTLAVPEAWSRGYAAMRSRNETTGVVASALYGLVLIGAAVSCVRRMARGAVRWRVAAGFSLAAFALVLLAEVNAFGAALFEYPTSESASAFLAERSLSLLAQAAGLALLVFFLTAGAESVYRESYPQKLALEACFTRRGLRTRRFFLAVIAGYALAALFFAYQTVFYRLAARLGAWAPADVPYDELLTTALPWASVLLIGFAPAVTEELALRAYAIPVLGRLFRSRPAALIVAGAIWGFGHAAYPNQPFYIRGLEVGAAGILVGWVLLRGELLTLLVWHYTVDAFYAALLLMRSRDAYLAGSAAAAAGLLLLPWLYALVAWLRARRFHSPQGLLNRDLDAPRGAVPDFAARPAAGLAVFPDAHLAAPSGADFAGGPAPAIAFRGERIPARRWALALALAALLLLILHALPARDWSGAGRIELSAAAAEARGREVLRELGAPLERLRLARSVERRTDPALLRHGERVAGGEESAAWVRARGGAYDWLVRAFAPGEAEEWRVTIGAAAGGLLAWERRVAEEQPADSLAEGEALALARGELLRRGIDPGAWRLAESRALPRPARRDWEFAWEPPADSARLGRAVERVRVRLAGGEVAGFARLLHLPPDAEHAERRRGPLSATSLAALGLLLIGTVALTLRRVRAATTGPLLWRPALLVAGAIALLQLGAAALDWPSESIGYDAREPWSLFVVRALVLWPASALLLGLALAVGFAIWSALLPRAARSLAPAARRAGARDAMLAALVAAAGSLAVQRLAAVLSACVPGAQAPSTMPLPPGLAGWQPLAAAWLGALPAACLEAAQVASVTALVFALARFLMPREGRIPPALLGLALCATIALLPQTDQSAGAFVASWLPLALSAALVLLLVRFLLRDQGPAHLAASLAVGIAQLATWLPAARSALATLAAAAALAGAGVALFLFSGDRASRGSD